MSSPVRKEGVRAPSVDVSSDFWPCQHYSYHLPQRTITAESSEAYTCAVWNLRLGSIFVYLFVCHARFFVGTKVIHTQECVSEVILKIVETPSCFRLHIHCQFVSRDKCVNKMFFLAVSCDTPLLLIALAYS